MAAGRKLGDAYIAVHADASTVGDELSTKASKALEDAARKMGTVLDQDLGDAVHNSTDGLGDTLGGELERGTERAGGKFAASMRKSLDAALKDLPDITLGADASDADRAIAGVREEIAALHGSSIGVDVSTADALASVDRIKVKLAELSSSSADASVKADTGAASVTLAAFQAELNRIDGQTAKVTVDADASGVDKVTGAAGRADSGLGVLISTAIALSPALISIGAAALAGIGAIGPLAAGAGAGIATMLLGFSGVSDAMKLVTKRQDTLAAQSTKSAGAGVSSAGAVESATRSLANTQANAADQAVTAAARVAAAQQGVTDAVAAAAKSQQAAERTLIGALNDVAAAQAAVTAARKTAQQQLEDLTNSVIDNSLAQRRSSVDVAAAKSALDKVLSNRRATDAQRAAAQLAYDEAIQHQSELQLAARRLGEQQADASAKGVDGADVVVAAQDKLLAAQQKLADAQVGVTDAQVAGARAVADAQNKVTDALRAQETQARQSAFSIAQAVAAVSSAAASGAAAGGAGASALALVDAQLAKVNPATLAFATFMQDRVMPVFEDIKGAAAGGLLPGVQSGLERLQPILPQITGFITSMSSTLGGIFDDLGKQLSSPFWTTFFDKLQKVAGPALTDMYDAGMNVVTAIAGIVEAFMPMSADMGDGIVGLTKKFADWATQLGDSQGFKDFIAYAKENGPKVMDLLEKLGTAVGHLISGLAGQGSGTLDALIAISGAIAGMDPSTLAGVADAIGGLMVAKSVVGGVGDLVQAGRDAKDTYNSVKDALGATKDGLVKFGGGVKDAAVAVGGGVADAASLASAYAGAAWSAVTNAASVAGAWISSAASTAASWAAMAATAVWNALVISATWVAETTATGFTVVAGWVATGLSVAAAWAGMAADAVLNALAVSATWLAETATTTITVLAGWAVAVGTVVAGWVLMATESLVNAARMAASWLIAMGPIGWIIGIVIALVAVIIANWDTIKSHTVKIFGAIGDFVSGIWSGLGNGLKAAVNWIIDQLNSIAVNSINVVIRGINHVPGVNIPEVPKIPRLAAGALVDRATLAVIGEAGPEVVIPLSAGKAGRRAQLMQQAGLSGDDGGGAGLAVDARQYYEVKDTQTAEEVGAVVGQRVVRDIRNGVSGRYGTGVAA